MSRKAQISDNFTISKKKQEISGNVGFWRFVPGERHVPNRQMIFWAGFPPNFELLCVYLTSFCKKISLFPCVFCIFLKKRTFSVFCEKLDFRKIRKIQKVPFFGFVSVESAMCQTVTFFFYLKSSIF